MKKFRIIGERLFGSRNESQNQDQFAHDVSPLFDERRLWKRLNRLCDAGHVKYTGSMVMNKGALALLVHGGTENWSPVRWKSRFDDVCAGRRVLLLPDASFDPSEVH